MFASFGALLGMFAKISNVCISMSPVLTLLEGSMFPPRNPYVAAV